MPGQYFDEETGLHHNLMRHYDPALGTYLEQDPLGVAITGVNRYAYVLGNPTNRYDPLGLISLQDAWNGAMQYEDEIGYVSLGATVVGTTALFAGGTAAAPVVAIGAGVAFVADAALTIINTKQCADFLEDPCGSPYGIEDCFLVPLSAIGAFGAGTAVFAAKGVGKGASNGYMPNRILPRNKYGEPAPDVPYPHSQLGKSPPKYGNEPQAREWLYDDQGKLMPKRDIDFTDHGYPAGHPNPHQHILTPNNPDLAPKGGFKRGPPSPLVYP